MLVKFISHAINGETYFKTMKVKKETKNRYMEKTNISLLFTTFKRMYREIRPNINEKRNPRINGEKER